ncbi:unnamed protein product [Rhizopus stolonifer]
MDRSKRNGNPLSSLKMIIVSKEEAACIFYGREYTKKNVEKYLKRIEEMEEVDICYTTNPRRPFLQCTMSCSSSFIQNISVQKEKKITFNYNMNKISLLFCLANSVYTLRTNYQPFHTNRIHGTPDEYRLYVSNNEEEVEASKDITFVSDAQVVEFINSVYRPSNEYYSGSFYSLKTV